MTLILILTRHAKSSWDTPGLPDHDRPLNKRGRNSATAIGIWLRENGWTPDELLSSSSARTRETWDRMGFSATDTTFTRALYHASSTAMLDVLYGASGKTVMMLGHNPGITGFAADLVETAPNHPRFFDYPTCATTVMEFPCESWQDVQPHSGKVLGFTVPRDLVT
ncbi:SixA phosphatase family protein [Primorskyibacter sp. S87]|uniref:SixA phosphatase family protein n=1 Tax=Primorskyibacter sp. S87 TaxID=3415126 RepID=UPI003C7A1382